MGFALPPKTIKKFKWKDLHGKFFKLAVAEPNPECLEPYGAVYGMDDKGVIYVLLEFDIDGKVVAHREGESDG